MKLLKEIAFAAALTLAALATSPFAQAHEAHIGNLLIMHPWSREVAPAATVAAGYMDITNNGKEDDTLVKATIDISDKTSLHEMSMTGDVMKMAEMKDGIPIPAGKTVKLMPMGFHIMFQALKAHPKKGELVNGSLTFAKAGTVKVEFMIEPSDAGMQ